MRFGQVLLFGIFAAGIGCSSSASDGTGAISPPGGSGGQGAGGGGQGGAGGASAGGGAAGSGVQKIHTEKLDVLLLVDNSSSMADKEQVLAAAVPDLLDRLLSPRCVAADGTPASTQPAGASDACPTGTTREIPVFSDVHIGIVTSSLGGHGADVCRFDPAQPMSSYNNPTKDDHGHLVDRAPRPDPNDFSFSATVPTYGGAGFLAWDPGQKDQPPGESDPAKLAESFRTMVLGVDQWGCGYESQLEGWYRFLVDPTPLGSITVAQLGAPAEITGVDQQLLEQRAAFLRPDSAVALILLSDEDDNSTIDGTLPTTVCDSPTLDASGKPTGTCASPGPWPASYHVERNFSASGAPAPFNYIVGAYKANGAELLMKSGTSACATDPYSPDCKECLSDPSGPGCHQLTAAEDGLDLRGWNRKQRFGWDASWPLQRYVDALTSPTVYDRDGNRVKNPLFAGGRDPRLVFYAQIVGVPWQDLAKKGPDGKPDLSLGYDDAVDWELVLGTPFETDPAKRHGPKDPWMVATNQPRSGTHPVTGEALDLHGWNSINGHEWAAGDNDLEYACTFALATPRACDDPSQCDCYVPLNPQTNMPDPALLQQIDDPVCEPFDPSDPTKQGKGAQSIDGKQYRAKAYPGARYLQVAKDVSAAGGNVVVASICAPNLDHADGADFGYRPAIDALVRRMAKVLE